MSQSSEGSDTDVVTAVRSSKFHTSKDCGPDLARRVECTLREAVEAQREPCGNCVGDDLREVYRGVRADV